MRTMLLIISSLFLLHGMIDAQNVKEYVRKCDEAYEEGNYEEALKWIDKAVRENDSSLYYRITKAKIELRVKGPEEALATLNRAKKMAPRNSLVYNSKGIVFEKSRRLDSALSMYNKGLRLAESDSARRTILENRGGLLTIMGELDNAEKDLKKVLEDEPKNYGALNSLARVYMKRDQKAKAVRTLEKVVQIDKNSATPHTNLGYLYSHMDSLELAMEHLEKAIELKPNDPYIYSNRGFAYYKMGKLEKAFEDLDRSLEDNPQNPYAHKNMALVYIAKEKPEKACEALGRAERLGFRKIYGDRVQELQKEHCE